ncbi:hypothetical protein SKAU_G00411940 [Synaphobranchus kaupii]|uniref:Transposase Helix-turn-helix domain-containing protein n=1 Tax=Synaphobranchus kaupii TaxID=118154 RepID=A0A9Q1E7X2_SYNKA|nr:hypothetical protein SKAU_G00411940 [Synaphobranchus kaupii]
METPVAVACVLIKSTVPVLRLYFEGQEDLKTDFRMSREAMNVLMRNLEVPKRHGWELELEVLILIYWLAHGASYSVVSRVFGMPKTSVLRAVHKIADLLLAIQK